MLKRTWLFVLPMVAALLYVGAAPSQAAGEKWIITGVNSTGCASSNWAFDVNFSGLDAAGGYVAHTTVTSGGLVYMNEDAGSPSNGDSTWHLYASSSYGPTTGTYPIPAGQPMKAVFSLERPKGTVVSSWTVIARTCDHGTLLYNAADLDQDTVIEALSADGCYTPASLDRPVGGEGDADPGGRTLGSVLGSEDPDFASCEARVVLRPLLSRLEERDRTVLKLRFVDGLTQREVGEEIGVTQMQVSRILSRIFNTLREELGEMPELARAS